MRVVLMLALAGTVVAGCEKCVPDGPRANVNVGVGSGGTVHGGVSVGQSCGPVHINVGTGTGYHWGW